MKTKLLRFARDKNIAVILTKEKHVRYAATATAIEPFKVTVYRCHEAPTNSLLYYLAHELGHIIDVRRTGVVKLHEEAKLKLIAETELSEKEKQQIFNRETAASHYGRELLRNFGQRNMNHFNRCHACNINFYQKRFWAKQNKLVKRFRGAEVQTKTE